MLCVNVNILWYQSKNTHHNGRKEKEKRPAWMFLSNQRHSHVPAGLSGTRSFPVQHHTVEISFNWEAPPFLSPVTKAACCGQMWAEQSRAATQAVADNHGVRVCAWVMKSSNKGLQRDSGITANTDSGTGSRCLGRSRSVRWSDPWPHQKQWFSTRSGFQPYILLNIYMLQLRSQSRERVLEHRLPLIGP